MDRRPLMQLALTVNGERRTLPGPATAQDLLAALGLDPRGVVVEVNRRIIRRPELPAAALNDGDVVELVHFVGGG